MRLVVHDFSGHPFQVQLSRELARRGHRVVHLHCPAYQSGKGALEVLPTDPVSLTIEPVDLGSDFEKHSARRVGHELRYGQLLVDAVSRHEPDAVISSNAPLLSQRALLHWARRARVPFTFWQQDVYSTAIAASLRDKLPVLGRVAGSWFVHLEARMLRRSDAVVTISADFLPVLDGWRVPRARVAVIENWAPLDELPSVERANAWARAHGLHDVRTVLYAGTLGMKHDPGLLLDLARSLTDQHDVRIVVVSEGPGAEWLRTTSADEGLPLVVLPFQPFDRFPQVLATADVLVAILEPEAGTFSVPSKILSYACAGRPVVAAIPQQNLAARTIAQGGWGIVVDPADPTSLADATRTLLDDAGLRVALGARGRSYAEHTFDIERIGDRFESVIAASRRSGADQPAVVA